MELERHLEKLTLEKGAPLDAEDLDDLGWKAAKKEGSILELGSLGEGAGGAVTRCVLKGGKTVFALKVRCKTALAVEVSMLTSCRSSQLIPILT